MKKYLCLMALAAIVGFGCTSCNKDDDDTSNRVSLKEPSTKTLAARYTIEQNLAGEQAATATFDDVQAVMSEIEVTEDAGILIKYTETSNDANAAATRSVEDKMPKEFWSWYDFTQNGSKLQIEGFGEIIIETNNGQAVITLIPDGISPLDVIASISTPNHDDELSNYLCRTWTIYSYQILITKNEMQVGKALEKSVDGTCDLKTLIDYANNEHGAGIKDDLGEKKIIKGITFTGNDSFIINYKGTDKKDVGYWEWTEFNVKQKSGTIAYSWCDESMGNNLLGGTATASFSDDECELRLDGKETSKNYTCQVRFKLK
ncbi:MAG: hypothetical protein K6E73_01670 [Bacteroidales bacterium]|nr:hypothetical protein [Bacteroidales bacterium]